MVVRRARVASTRPLAVYGGVRLHEEVLEELAIALRAGLLPMMFNHDFSEPLAAQVLDAGVELVGDGEKAVWVEFFLPDQDWAMVEARFNEAGVAGGMSFSAGEPIGIQSDSELFTVAADAHHYSDNEILAAIAFGRGYSVNAQRLYQFALIPEAAILVQFAWTVLSQVPVDLLSSEISIVIRKLWRSDRSGPITVRATRDGDRAETVLAINPRNSREFEIAMRQLPDTLRAVAELQKSQDGRSEAKIQDGPAQAKILERERPGDTNR